jgi:hypothetical protein
MMLPLDCSSAALMADSLLRSCVREAWEAALCGLASALGGRWRTGVHLSATKYGKSTIEYGTSSRGKAVLEHAPANASHAAAVCLFHIFVSRAPQRLASMHRTPRPPFAPTRARTRCARMSQFCVPPCSTDPSATLPPEHFPASPLRCLIALSAIYRSGCDFAVRLPYRSSRRTFSSIVPVVSSR